MIKKTKRIKVEDVYAGLTELINSELPVDVQWLARLTATPDTVLELLLESAQSERCPKIRLLYMEIKAEERLSDYIQCYRFMKESERAELSYSITNNKLFLVP